MKTLFLATLLLAVLAGCDDRSRKSPDQLRHETAQATKEAAQDAKAVAQGIADGVKSAKDRSTNSANQLVNINSAGPDELKSLPGIDDARAERIINHRPYNHSDDLVKKRVISQSEYDRISSQIDAH